MINIMYVLSAWFPSKLTLDFGDWTQWFMVGQIFSCSWQKKKNL